jgi:outer membrane receptor protein involved in Fe transport
MTYQAGEKLKIDVMGRYNIYQLYHNAYAWNLPVLQFTTRGAYNLYDKFYAQIDANIETGRKALVGSDAPNAQSVEGQSFVDLGAIVDVNLGLEYRYTPRISLFLQANNLAAQRYNRWYSYPVQPFQVMGGFTARF